MNHFLGTYLRSYAASESLVCTVDVCHRMSLIADFDGLFDLQHSVDQTSVRFLLIDMHV